MKPSATLVLLFTVTFVLSNQTAAVIPGRPSSIPSGAPSSLGKSGEPCQEVRSMFFLPENQFC
jgi:hypothetical protein